MSAFRGNSRGSGQRSVIESTRRNVLVRAGKACHYKPYRSVDLALAAAGLADPEKSVDSGGVYGIYISEESSEPKLL
jgi:hypothetical protein